MTKPVNRNIALWKLQNGPLRCLSPQSDCYAGARPEAATAQPAANPVKPADR